MDFHSQSRSWPCTNTAKRTVLTLLATHSAINEGIMRVVTAQESDVHGPDGIGRPLNPTITASFAARWKRRTRALRW